MTGADARVNIHVKTASQITQPCTGALYIIMVALSVMRSLIVCWVWLMCICHSYLKIVSKIGEYFTNVTSSVDVGGSNAL